MSLKLYKKVVILRGMAVEEYNKMASYYDTVLEPILWSMRRKIIKVGGIYPGMKMLEVACGTGSQGKRFNRAGAEYTGIDLSPAMLEVAQKHNLTCIHGDATSLDDVSETFDLTTVTLALHEVDPEIREAIAREMIRVTKSSGRILLVDYTIPLKLSPYSRLAGKSIHFIEKLVGGSHYRNYLRFMKSGGLSAFISSLDVETVETHYIFGGSIGIILLRKNLVLSVK